MSQQIKGKTKARVMTINKCEFRPADMVNFEDVIAVAEEFIPTIIKRIIGQSNIENGLQILLQHFQDPLLNKQVSLD